MIRAYFQLPRRERVGHVLMVVAGLIMLMTWLHYSPGIIPTCRTMAIRALSSETEALVTGTSRVERGVDPRLFEFDLINISSGGLAYLTMTPMIKRSIERAPHVRLVVIEFDVFLLKGEGLIQDRLFELGLPMRDWPMPLKDRFWFVLQNGGVLSSLPRMDVEYFSQSIRANERPPPDSNGYNPYSFLRDLTEEGSDELYGATKYLTMHRQELVGSLDDDNVLALLDLLHWLDERNIRWALVTLPHLPGWIRGRPDEWELSVESAMQKIQHEYKGGRIRFWDASSSLGLDIPHFHDGLHLNHRGVEKFNRELSTQMTVWLNE